MDADLLENKFMPYPDYLLERWKQGDYSMLTKSNASDYLKKILVHKAKTRPGKRFFGEVFKIIETYGIIFTIIAMFFHSFNLIKLQFQYDKQLKYLLIFTIQSIGIFTANLRNCKTFGEGFQS